MPTNRPVPEAACRPPALRRISQAFRAGTLPGRSRQRAGLIRGLLAHLAALALWVICWTLALALPTLPATFVIVALTGAAIWWYLRRPLRKGRVRACATLRLRPLGRATPRVLAAVPVWLLFNTALAAVYVDWIATPPPEPADPLALHAARQPGWVPLAVQGLILAPIIEEVFFRGFIQRSMERRFGPLLGIVLAALLFAAFHGETWKFGYLLAGGIMLGVAVHATRSLWAGVILHASANAFGVLLDAVRIPVSGSSPGQGGGMLVVLVASAALLAWMMRGLRNSASTAPVPQSAPARLPNGWSSPTQIG